MSRSGYSDDCDNLALWRGVVASAIRGKRGQAMLRDLLAALDAMQEKRLAAEVLEADGEVCAMGALGRVRGIDMTKLDPEEPEGVARAFGVASPLVREIAYMNDEGDHWMGESPEQRWSRMRAWVAAQIKEPKP